MNLKQLMDACPNLVVIPIPGPALHPANKSYGVSPFKLRAGDVLVQRGQEFTVCEGFDRDTSSCWRDSRFVRCINARGSIDYVNPVGAYARSGGAK